MMLSYMDCARPLLEKEDRTKPSVASLSSSHRLKAASPWNTYIHAGWRELNVASIVEPWFSQ
jgi:hypothetical protein